MEERTAGRRATGILAVAGGLLAIAGSTLVWFSVRADTTGLGGRVLTRNVRGTEASDGKVTLVAGAVVILAAVLALVVREPGSRRVLSALVCVGALVAGGLALYDVATAKSQVIDSAVDRVGHVGLTVVQVRALLERAFDTDILKISPGIGIMLVMAGGTLALAGGVAGLLSRGPVGPVPVGLGAEPGAPEEPVPSGPAPAPEEGPSAR